MTLLDRFTIFTLLFYVALRPFSSGLDLAEPETLFLSMIAFIGWTSAICGVLRVSKLILPDKIFGGALLAFALFALHALFRANAGNWQTAVDLAWIWVADFQIFWALLIVCRQFPLTRALIGVLGASLVVAVLFGLYQRYFALGYLQSLLAATDSLAVDESFWIRIASTRIAGQLSYANAYANFLVALLPLFVPIFLARRQTASGAADNRRRASGWRERGILIAIMIATLLALVYSGSKAGILVAKIVEWLTLYYVIPGSARKWWRLGEIAGYIAIGTLIGGGLAAFAGQLGYSALIKESVLAIAWSGEILFLLYHLLRFPARKKIAIAGAALTMILLIGGVIAAVKIPAIRQEVAKQIGVRGNYWLSAVAMIKDHPLRGFGLDNFGAYYAKYKRPAGWETRRVHNVYLQLAVDGGIGLSAAFIALWAIFFRRYRAAPTLPWTPPVSKGPPPFSRLATFAGISAFGATYLLFLTGAFNGLGIEYFSTAWAQRENYAPVLISGAVNLLLLPLAWIFTCRWLIDVSAQAADFLSWLRIGILAMLLHFAFDFHLYQAANSALLWIFAALALAECGRGAFESVLWHSQARKLMNRIIALLIIGAGVWLALFGVPRFGAGVNRYLVEKMNLERSLSAPRTQIQLELLDAALPERPRDAGLWVDRANAQVRLGKLPDAIDSARAAIFADPQSMGSKVFLASLLERLPYADFPRLQEIQYLYRAAIMGYPLKPRYRALYANFLWRYRVTDPDLPARILAQSALALDAATDDIAEKLSPLEKQIAQEIVAADRR